MIAPTWDELYPQVPDELRPYVLELEWDRERLWRLELPVEEMSVAELVWQLALPGGVTASATSPSARSTCSPFRILIESTSSARWTPISRTRST